MSAPLVLIADNDRAVSSLLVEVLARHGFRVTTAFDGDAAARLARDVQVRVLVCDLDMPGRTGLEVLELLAGLDAAPPTVVISGYLDESIERRLSTFPFVRAILKKPFDLFRFGDCIRDLAGVGMPAPKADGVDAAGNQR